jgi:hypothetical protein
VVGHQTQLLYAPSSVPSGGGGGGGGHWGTLMPFLRACEKSGVPPRPLPAPTRGQLPQFSSHQFSSSSSSSSRISISG